ncbi:MAG: hypothetical protein HFI15_07275 [Lachnospiraceae bacterium]|jgi:hypothetical protein|nr:hypothetical protein [Lachnospiraceae bacterium]
MKEHKKTVIPSWGVVLMFAAAVLLLFSGSIGGARAALTYYSETYTSRVQMYDIGVTLLEQGEHDQEPKAVSWRNYDARADGTWDEAQEEKGYKRLLEGMLDEDAGESLKLGKTYREELKVQNTGTINQYVRVSIYRYWLDEDGNKLQTLSPELIDLHLVNLDTDWLEDTAINEVTRERTVLYYNKLLLSGEETPLFADSLTIDDSIAKKVSEQKVTEGGRTTITTTYDYDGVQFQIEVEVDAVQEHNAEDAVWSVWGRRVKVENNTLSLQ